MLTAREVMTREVVTITPEIGLEECISRLVNNKISGMPVCDKDGAVVGMISEKDLLNFIFSGTLKETKVGEAMSTHVTSFPPDTSLDKIALVMGEKQIRRVPIIENGRLLGIVSRRSIIRTVLSMK
ncbi:MAG: CBS domain-containing protein [Endomicrobiales bacterium]|nr:CBS domain-containing protein [Endomicrobiales bacterium]